MDQPVARSPNAGELVRRLDLAVEARGAETICQAVKNALVDAVSAGEGLVGPEFLAPHPERYARRLLHRDPAGRYTVVVMVWDKGQGTPLHDHAGMWCVECVYRGRIRVTSYRIEGDPEEDAVRIREESVVLAGVGEAGALIPPFEYHKIENPDATPAVTIHVYGGEMTWCHAFYPAGPETYRRAFRTLSYTP